MSRKYKIFAGIFVLYIVAILLFTIAPGQLKFFGIAELFEHVGVLNSSTVCTAGFPDPDCITNMTPTLTVYPHLLMLAALLGISNLADFLVSAVTEKFSWQSEHIIFATFVFVYLGLVISVENFVIRFSSAFLTGFGVDLIPYFHTLSVLALIGLAEILTTIYRMLSNTSQQAYNK